MKQLLCTVFLPLVLCAWQDGAEIKSEFVQELSNLGSFEGHPEDHLTILDQTETSLFVGARDTLFNLSLTDLTKLSITNWTVSREHQDICQIKGQKESECHNFIKLFHGPITSQSPSKSPSYLVCGTHAYKPKCRWYDPSLGTFSSEFSGIGYSPFSPSHPSKSLLHYNSVYTATVADFAGTDSLIYKQPLRTEQNYDLQLSSPSFVSTLSLGDLALFFFKETAVENSNCGKTVFSRVARICRHDSGSRKHKDRFTTFLKARLNCSIPGEFPFYFDHIQGTTEMFTNGELGQEMLYAVFSTPPNSIHATAVCAFTAADILKAFEGPFKGQSSPNSNWLPVAESKVPQPRPGRCSNDSSSPDLTSAAFIKSHPLMDEAVQGTPVLTMTTSSFVVSSIVVDHSPELAPFHVIYLGTESGKVVKAVVNASAAGEKLFVESDFKSENTVISQSWQVFPNEKIKSLRLSATKQLIAATETGIRIVPVHNCERFGASCAECVGLRDPHCAWDLGTSSCIFADPNNKSSEWVQSINLGVSNQCPLPKVDKPQVTPAEIKTIEDKPKECCSCVSHNTAKDIEQSASLSRILLVVNDPDEVTPESRSSKPENRTANKSDFDSSPEPKRVRPDSDFIINRSVVLATTSTGGVALLIGFTLGFIVARLLSSKRIDKSPAGSQIGILSESRKSTKPIDFVLNVPTMNKYASDKCNTLNTRTLEKTVKKVYL